MNIEQLFLKKEELPILNETCFQIPIHPKLLDSSLNIDKLIAQKIFPPAVEILYMDNGLVKSFSMDKNKSGTLYFNKQELNYKSYACTLINFSEEKCKEFAHEKRGSNIFVYSRQHINTFSKASSLRNWVIEYMNEVFKQVF